MPELLNAGRSEAGFSRVGQAMLCHQLYAYTELLEVEGLGNRDPLHRGSLIHTGEAHYWERLRRAQQIQAARAKGWTEEQLRSLASPDALYEPVAAIHAHAEVMRAEGIPVKDEIEAISARAMADLVLEHELARVQPIVVSVEQEHRALIATDAAAPSGQPEITVYREDVVLRALAARGLRLVKDERVPFLRRVEGEAPGYTGPQAFYLYTQRIDLVTWRPGPVAGDDGQPVWNLQIEDHKSTNHYKTGHYGTVRAYSMHGQFWGLRHLGALYYPELATQGRIKLMINIIQMPGPKNNTAWIQEPPEPAPWREARHWRNVWDNYTALRRLIESGRDPWDFPATGHEMACMLKRYGRCEAWELCQRGKAALPSVQLGSMDLGGADKARGDALGPRIVPPLPAPPGVK